MKTKEMKIKHPNIVYIPDPQANMLLPHHVTEKGYIPATHLQINSSKNKDYKFVVYSEEGELIYCPTSRPEGDIRIVDTKRVSISDDGQFRLKNLSDVNKLGLMCIGIECTNLSAEAYSKIFTEILKFYDYDFSIVEGGAIAVRTHNDEFNDPSPNVRFLSTSMVPHGTPFKINLTTVPTDTVDEHGNITRKEPNPLIYLRTVEAVVSFIGLHEYEGHGEEKYASADSKYNQPQFNFVKQGKHYKCYALQERNETFNLLPKDIQIAIVEHYRRFLHEEDYNSQIDRKLYKFLHP